MADPSPTPLTEAEQQSLADPLSAVLVAWTEHEDGREALDALYEAVARIIRDARADAWDEGAFYGIGWPAAQGHILAAGNPYRDREAPHA